MIIGIGHDQVDIRRIGETLARFGSRFLDRVYTTAEQARAARKTDPIPTYAKRWAAKEAVAKALHTGIGAQASMREIEVQNGPAGQPFLRLSGNALKTLEKMTPSGYQAHLHLSLSDDWPFASAFVIIEALPKDAA